MFSLVSVPETESCCLLDDECLRVSQVWATLWSGRKGPKGDELLAPEGAVRAQFRYGRNQRRASPDLLGPGTRACANLHPCGFVVRKQYFMWLLLFLTEANSYGAEKPEPASLRAAEITPPYKSRHRLGLGVSGPKRDGLDTDNSQDPAACRK
jgi:hypothetical protein